MTTTSTEQSKLNESLALAATAGDVSELARLLALGADPMADASRPLFDASRKGHVECVRLLIPVSNTKALDSRALRGAALAGHAECVRLLAPVSNSSDDEFAALTSAASNGHAECVKLLLSDECSHQILAFCFGCSISGGHASVAAVFLAHNPDLIELLNLAEATATALDRRHCELAALLTSISERDALLVAAAAMEPSTPTSAPRL